MVLVSKDGMIHLINASDLNQWADRPESKINLPLLVRRLISLSIKGTTEYTVRAEVGVQYGGWDGIIRNAEQESFQVPQGDSFWEFGCGQEPKSKANEDYDKRTINPLGVVPANSTFVFVTPRNWSGRDDWAKEKSAECKWKRVVALDADSLKSWLDSIPSIHVWATILLGKPVQGLMGLEQWWEIWRKRTNPTITQEMILCGRSETKEAISTWYVGNSTQVSLVSGTIEEAAGILAATVALMDPNISDAFTARTLMVFKGSSLSGALVGRTNAILVVEQDDVERVRLDVGEAHRIIALGNETTENGRSIEADKLDPRELCKLLVAAGIPENEASGLAGLARRSFQAFRRQKARNSDSLRPEWAKNPNYKHLIVSIVLAQRWNGAEGSADRNVISEMAGGLPYADIENKCRELAALEDPPIRQVGSQWSVISLLDAWTLTQAHLTTDLMTWFEKAAIHVLSEGDPRFDIPAPERIYAFMDGNNRRKYSDALRKGLSDSLAMLSANGNSISNKRDYAPDALPKRIGDNLFDFKRLTAKSWYSLADLLPDLAEANPGAFLSACENDLQSQKPLLYGLYVDSDNVFMASSPHVYLLWALERLAWNPSHLKRVVIVLARLAANEKPGKNGNRATASLGNIFLAWIAYTAATVSQKLIALDGVRKQCPDQAWSLMIGLLPSVGGFASTTARPSWADWIPLGLEGYSQADYREYLLGIVQRLLEDAGTLLVRLGALFEKFNILPPESMALIFDRLMALDPRAQSDPECRVLVDDLRGVVARHRTYKDADWAMPEEQLQPLIQIIDRFAPADPILGNIWLFKHWVELPDGEKDDYHAKEKAVEGARSAAIRVVLAHGGLTAVCALASKVEMPRFVGAILADPNVFGVEHQDQILLFANSVSASDQAIAMGYACARYRGEKLDWLAGAMSRMRSRLDDNQIAALALESDHAPSVWELVDTFGAGVSTVYWRRIHLFYISEEQALAGAKRLVENKRPFSAVRVLGNAVSHKRYRPSASDALSIMLAACDGDPKEDQIDSSFSWALGHLLDYVSEQLPDAVESLAKIEWVLLPSLNRHQPDRGPKSLHQHLNKHPEFFVELVKNVYRAANQTEPRKEPFTDAEQHRATRSYQLLDGWRSAPGLLDDGTLDAVACKAWVVDARDRLKAVDRASIGDLVLGQILSGSPKDPDGCWPGAVVRSIIEDLQSDSLERGLANGRYNSRGVVSKGIFDGGAQEHALAAQYKKWAGQVEVDCPRTANLLRGMSQSYSHDGSREDRDNDLQLDGYK